MIIEGLRARARAGTPAGQVPPVLAVRLPPIAEYRCGSCNEFSALVVGEEIDIDNPDTETVLMVCHARDPRPVLCHFRACNDV